MQHNSWLLFAAGAALALLAPASGCGGNSKEPSSSSGGAGGTEGGAGNGGVSGSSGAGGSSGGSESGGSGGSGGATGVGGSGGSAAGGTGGSGGAGGAGGSGGSAAGASGAAGETGDPVCSADNAETACDDDDACTVDSCDAMSCAHTAVVCNDNNSCTDDSCDPETGCTTSPHDCSDGDTCTFDLCDPEDGCSHPALEVCVPTVGGCAGRVAQFSRSPNLPTVDVDTVEDTLSVTGLTGRIWGVVLTTNIEHTFNQDLVIELVSPEGRTHVLSSQNGGLLDDIFAGTVWRDAAEITAMEATYVDQQAAPELIPQNPLAGLRGEIPNGNWTLRITDEALEDGGALVSWGMTIATLDQEPQLGTLQVDSGNISVPVTTDNPVTETLEVSGLAGPLCKVEVTTELPHAYAGDLALSLVSPEGTTVRLSTEFGGPLVNAFAGTLWSDQAEFSVVSFPYVDGYPADTVSPEIPLEQLLGEDGNGTWSLMVEDRAAGDDGTLESWGLSVSTCSCE